jgi:DNA-binding transcriptional LysR family regulator
MNIECLKEFLTLVDSGTYLEAAERLFMSQSTLSRHIQKMEAELGCKLFERTTRRVKLTKFGEMLLPYAKQITKMYEEYMEIMLKNLETSQSRVVVGSIPTLGHYNITEALVSFKKLNPLFELQVIEAESQALIEMLYQKKCDFVFVRETGSNQASKEFVKIPFDKDNLVAILPVEHRLSKLKKISLWELRKESFILLPKETLVYKICLDACRKAGFEPKIALTCDRGENIVSLVEKGVGIALLMKKPVAHLIQYRVVFIDIVPEIQTQISLYYLKKAQFSKAAKVFLKCVKLSTQP